MRGGGPSDSDTEGLLSSLPTMWRDVAGIADVGPGGMLPISVDALELLLWRYVEGRLAACDRRCPHQWADLGSAGAVDGEELVCLSHHWRFDAAGWGSKLSVTGRRDEKAPVEVFEVEEREGRIRLRIDSSMTAD